MVQEIQTDELSRLKQQVALNPASFKDILALADMYVDLERWTEAIEQYKTAISLEPSNADVYNSLGTIYEEVDQLDEAEKAYQQAIKFDPKLPAPYYNLGCMYEDQQHLQKAVQAYKKYLEYVEAAGELAIVKHNLTKVTRMNIRRVNGASLAKILGVMYVAIGLIFWIISIVFSLFFIGSGFGFFQFFDVFNLLALPIIYGIVGVVSGFLIAYIYNFVADRFGGIEIEAE